MNHEVAGTADVVAGIGYRSAATGADILDVVRRSMSEYGVDALRALAMPGFKPANDIAPNEAARALGLRLSMIGEPALTEAAPRCLTKMRHAMPGAGDKSVAEACALAVAGEGGTLLGPRIVGEMASCALAHRIEPKP